mgnify:CR=1 FL=1
MDEYNDDSLESIFGKSLKNMYSEYNDYNVDLEISAMENAQKLNFYLKTVKYEKISTRNLVIITKDNKELLFQSTEVKFIKDEIYNCKVEFSVPINFNGEIRIWTQNFIGQKVWSTVNKIYHSNCNNEILFDFLGKYTHRFSQDDFSDLPF